MSRSAGGWMTRRQNAGDNDASRRKLRYAVLIPLMLAVLTVCPQVARAVDGAVIVYTISSISETAFQRILNADNVRYVCTEEGIVNCSKPLTRNRVQQLANAGKRVLLQLWWGPNMPYPWSKYSFPNVALDESVRADFFTWVVDYAINGIGAQNLYGVYLLEETGMQFATDVGPRENPDDFWTFTPLVNTYAAPYYSGSIYSENGSPGGVHIANVRRHESDFTAMTGFNFANASSWSGLESYLFARWVSVRLQSKGQIEFAKHIHQKYPALKAFTWDFPFFVAEDPRTDLWSEAQHFDGVIADPYSSVLFNYYYQHTYRTLFPNAEIINFCWGGMSEPYVDLNTKRASAVGAYMAGADAIGFFESPMDYTRPDAWAVNTQIFDSLKNVPRFSKASSVLLVTDEVSLHPGLKHFDVVPSWEAHDIDYSKYRMVIIAGGQRWFGRDSLLYWDSKALKQQYGLPGTFDHEALETFVAGGGVLILSGQIYIAGNCPLFVASEGYLHTPNYNETLQLPLVVSPTGWLRDQIGLSREYRCSVGRIGVSSDPERVVSTNAGYFFRHGTGAVFFFPFTKYRVPGEDIATSPEWRDYGLLLTDVTRGVLNLLGKPDIASEYLIDSSLGNGYMQATSQDGRATGYALRNDGYGSMLVGEWQIPGRDVLTGVLNPVLSNSNRSAIVMPSFSIKRYSLSAGGGQGLSSAHYRLSGTLGQSLAGTAANANYKAYMGFWVPEESSPPPVPVEISTLDEAKALADGTPVSVTGKIATTDLSDFGEFFYIQELDRSSGIRVMSSSISGTLARGKTVSLEGTMDTTDAGERQIVDAAVVVGSEAIRLIAPAGMNNRVLGGGDFGDPSAGLGQYGVIGGAGTNTIGLLIRTWGQLTGTGTGYVTIDDGSAVAVRVDTTGLSTQPSGYATVTGISSLHGSAGNADRLVLAID